MSIYNRLTEIHRAIHKILPFENPKFGQNRQKSPLNSQKWSCERAIAHDPLNEISWTMVWTSQNDPRYAIYFFHALYSISAELGKSGFSIFFEMISTFHRETPCPLLGWYIQKRRTYSAYWRIIHDPPSGPATITVRARVGLLLLAVSVCSICREHGFGHSTLQGSFYSS
jgi:hypothetical protein